MAHLEEEVDALGDPLALLVDGQATGVAVAVMVKVEVAELAVACSEAVAGASDGPRATLVDAAAVAATVVVWVVPQAEALETG